MYCRIAAMVTQAFLTPQYRRCTNQRICPSIRHFSWKCSVQNMPCNTAKSGSCKQGWHEQSCRCQGARGYRRKEKIRDEKQEQTSGGKGDVGGPVHFSVVVQLLHGCISADEVERSQLVVVVFGTIELHQFA